MGSVSGLGSSPAEIHGNPLRYSCLENPMDRGAWQATVHRVQFMLSCFSRVWLFATPWIIAHQAPLPSSRGSCWPRDWTHVSYVSCIGRRVLYNYHHLGSPNTHTPIPKKTFKKKLFLHVCRPGTALGGPGGKKQWVYLSFFRVQHLKVTQCLSDEKRKHFCNPLLLKQTMRECCWIQFLQIMWVKVECLCRTKNSFYYRIWLLSEDKIEEY